MLVTVLTRHADDVHLVVIACEALRAAAANEAGRASLLELGAPMAIADARSRHHDGGAAASCEIALRALGSDEDPRIIAARTCLRRRRPVGTAADVCAHDDCGAVGILICSGCLRTLYCSKACQTADWLPTGQHRAECRAMREAAAKLAKAVAAGE